MPDNLRLAQRIALVLGAFELPAALLWAVLGAGIYGSPLSGVQREGLLIIAALFVLAGPLWMLPLAIVARSWPRAAGRLLLAGAMCASVLAVHPWGLAYADYSLYTNVWVAVLGVSLVTAGVGVALLTTGRRSKAWLEVLGIAGAAIVGMIAVTSAIERRDVAVRWHTTYPINFLAFAPDGRSLIAAGKYSGSNAHWERYGKASLSVVNAATGEVRVLAERTSKHLMTPDRGTLITINDETHLWDTRTWTQRATVESTSNVAFPARGLLVIKQRARLLLIDVTTGNTRWSIEYERDNQPAWLAVSGDATTLAAGGWPRGGAARIWDVATQRSRVIPVIETEPITEAQFSPDGALLAMRAEAKGITRLRLWSLRQNRALPSLDEQAFSHFLWFSPDGRSMVTWLTPRDSGRDVSGRSPRGREESRADQCPAPRGVRAEVRREPTLGETRRSVATS